KLADRPALAGPFDLALSLARRVKDQRQRERGRKVYSLHAPEVECIGKGKVHKPYEFGVKVSVATPLNRCKGGQFVVHVKALPGNPYDSHSGDAPQLGDNYTPPDGSVSAAAIISRIAGHMVAIASATSWTGVLAGTSANRTTICAA
ncbi:hypothetical protein QO011_008548, partial [Labrys wisconsinensis]|nr:hypothetical protein [Labrys wisconsinensis]